MASSKSKAPKALPKDVLAALKAAVVRLGSQTKVALDLGVSQAVVNQLLRDRYLGDVSKMAERIRGQYLAETVTCPVMGELGRRHCLDYQVRPLAHTNPQRVRLFQACKTCPNRKVTS
ncbi:hypothetical protein [Variovorax paradoxus]|uniref:hypothetical protein n=1 Tax=Variovorax paradoxus TaxID=34073 RepID=UPI001ABC58D9